MALSVAFAKVLRAGAARVAALWHSGGSPALWGRGCGGGVYVCAVCVVGQAGKGVWEEAPAGAMCSLPLWGGHVGEGQGRVGMAQPHCPVSHVAVKPLFAHAQHEVHRAARPTGGWRRMQVCPAVRRRCAVRGETALSLFLCGGALGRQPPTCGVPRAQNGPAREEVWRKGVWWYGIMSPGLYVAGMEGRGRGTRTGKVSPRGSGLRGRRWWQ